MVPVLALPLQDQVDQFGGYIGLAAFFGLAVLTVLSFAQAREVKRLREWAGRSPERALDLEERVLAQAEQARKARPQAVPQPVAAPAAAAVAAGPVAKPAVAAVAAAHPGTKVHPAAAAIPAAVTAAGAAAPAVAPASGNGEPPTTAAPPVAPPNGRPQEGPVTGTGAPPAAAPPLTPTPAPAPAARPAPALPPRPAPVPAAAPAARRAPATYGAATAARRPANRDRGGRSTTTLALIAGAVAVALAGLVFLGTQLLGGGDDPAPVPNQVDATATPDPAGGAVAGQSVEEGRQDSVVAVLNGTTSSGLAASIAERLESEGYPQGGKVETGPDQTVASTIVYYAEGKRAQARDVAKLLGGADVSPMNPDNQALAGANAKLLVIVGSDKAPSQ